MKETKGQINGTNVRLIALENGERWNKEARSQFGVAMGQGILFEIGEGEYYEDINDFAHYNPEAFEMLKVVCDVDVITGVVEIDG